MATLPGAWYYRVSAGTGRPGFSILWLGEVESSATCISVWQHVKLSEQIRPWDTLACCWDVKQPTSKQTLSGVGSDHVSPKGIMLWAVLLKVLSIHDAFSAWAHLGLTNSELSVHVSYAQFSAWTEWPGLVCSVGEGCLADWSGH